MFTTTKVNSQLKTMQVDEQKVFSIPEGCNLGTVRRLITRSKLGKFKTSVDDNGQLHVYRVS